MPTLYTHAEENIRKTWLYLTGFLLLLIGLGWLISYSQNSPIILWLAVILSISISFLSYWQSDKVVLKMAGARPIKKEDNPELYRLVENLSITAGLPLPAIYIINEAQPNAFATGRDPEHAVIAVTSGLLERLDRQELEGVIGHELSHIGNRDMLLATMMVVLVGAVTIMADFLRRGFWRRSNRQEGERQIRTLLMFAGLILGLLAPFFALLLRLAISRKREFLADASGVLLTRYPEGLISALTKISADPRPLKTANRATAHLYIVNPFRGKAMVEGFDKLFSTHPPIKERIKALSEVSI